MKFPKFENIITLLSMVLNLFLRCLGGNSQNVLHKFVRFFVTLRCFYTVVIHRNRYYMLYAVIDITLK